MLLLLNLLVFYLILTNLFSFLIIVLKHNLLFLSLFLLENLIILKILVHRLKDHLILLEILKILKVLSIFLTIKIYLFNLYSKNLSLNVLSLFIYILYKGMLIQLMMSIYLKSNFYFILIYITFNFLKLYVNLYLTNSLYFKLAHLLFSIYMSLRMMLHQSTNIFLSFRLFFLSVFDFQNLDYFRYLLMSTL